VLAVANWLLCVAFNPEPLSEPKTSCNLTTFTIRGGSPKFEHWRNWYCCKWEAFDPRSLEQSLYHKLIETYGEDVVRRSHLQSSAYSDQDNNLIIALKEIERLHDRGLPGRKQWKSVQDAYNAVENGADPNLVVDSRRTPEMRPLHYARYLNNSNFMISFIRFMRDHGADPNLGRVRGGCKETPWYFYKEEGVMIENGELHDAIGGQAGGPIATDEGEAGQLEWLSPQRKKVIISSIILILIIIFSILVSR